MGNLKFLFIDCGGFNVDTARTIGAEGHKVYYHCPWQSAYAKFEAYAPGLGVPEIEKVIAWAPYLDEVDCIVFPDVGMGELADWMRHKGYIVFGAGKGEEMEQDRVASTQMMQKLGMKCPKTYSVNGIPKALETIREIVGQKNETNQNSSGKCFVKFNIWRGSIEGFPAKSVEEAEFMFDAVKSALGPYANSVPICIQETVEGIETGADLFFNGEDFVMPGMWGFEDGGNYVGFITNDMTIFKNDLDRAAKYLRSVNYRGPFSFECIYDGTDCYWIDWTCRYPMPLGLMYATFMKGYGQFILDVAMGQAKSVPLPMNEFIGCMQIMSEEANDRYLPLNGGENTKFMRYMMQDGKKFAVPGVSLLGVCSARGETLPAVERGIEDEANSLSIFFGVFDKKFMSTIREKYIVPLQEEHGIIFGGAPEQTPIPVSKKDLNLKINPNKSAGDLDPWGIPQG